MSGTEGGVNKWIVQIDGDGRHGEFVKSGLALHGCVVRETAAVVGEQSAIP